jgi:hypothetical protein
MTDFSTFWTGITTTLGTVATFAGAFTYSSLKDVCEKSRDSCILLSVTFMMLVIGLFCAVGAAVLVQPGITSAGPLGARLQSWIIASAVFIVLGYILLTVSIGLLYSNDDNYLWIVVGITLAGISAIVVAIICQSCCCKAEP